MRAEERKKDAAVDKYPKQTLSDLTRLKNTANLKQLRNINKPKGENFIQRLGRVSDGNCPCCAAAFEMTQRGYNVIARRRISGARKSQIEGMFDGAKTISINNMSGLYAMERAYNEKRPNWKDVVRKQQDKMANKVYDEITKQGSGARGFIELGWMSSLHPSKPSWSHIFNYANIDGKPYFFDAQIGTKEYLTGLGTKRASEDIFSHARPGAVSLTRTDTFEPTDNIMQFVYSPSKIRHSESFAYVFDDNYLIHANTVEDAKSAYDLICEVTGTKPVIIEAREYKDYYGFYLAPEGTKNKSSFQMSLIMIFVDKRTGKIVFEEDLEDIREQDYQEAIVG